MTIQYSIAKLILGLGFATTMHIASATTYTNLQDLTPVKNIGGTDTNQTIAQIFTAPGGVLQSFEFYAVSGYQGEATFGIVAWDAGRPVGNTLYSAPVTYFGGAQTLSANDINLELKPDTEYLAVISAYGVGSLKNLVLQGSASDAGLDGAARIRYVPWGEWERTSAPNLAFTANFTSAVPEPETYAMLLIGLGLIGWMNRRKQQAKNFS